MAALGGAKLPRHRRQIRRPGSCRDQERLAVNREIRPIWLGVVRAQNQRGRTSRDTGAERGAAAGDLRRRIELHCAVRRQLRHALADGHGPQAAVDPVLADRRVAIVGRLHPVHIHREARDQHRLQNEVLSWDRQRDCRRGAGIAGGARVGLIRPGRAFDDPDGGDIHQQRRLERQLRRRVGRDGAGRLISSGALDNPDEIPDLLPRRHPAVSIGDVLTAGIGHLGDQRWVRC